MKSKQTVISKPQKKKRGTAERRATTMTVHRHGFCRKSCHISGENLFGTAFKILRGRVVRGIHADFEPFSSLFAGYEVGFAGPYHENFVEYGEVAVAYVNGVAFVETRRTEWSGRRAPQPQPRRSRRRVRLILQ